jgi:hypothetical protein
LDNPKFILIDEGDFFSKGEQEDVRHVSERYIAKSDPYIVMVSTPDGLFERIEKESEDDGTRYFVYLILSIGLLQQYYFHLLILLSFVEILSFSGLLP